MGELSGSLSLGAYVGKAVLALAVLAVSGWLFVYAAKRRGWLKKGSDRLCMISSLSLGRDVFFVLRCGPEVLAVVSGPSGSRLMGRWSVEEWDDSERDRDELH